MSYVVIELLIVLVAIILFAISFCGFLQKWKHYVQGINAEHAQQDKNRQEEEDPPAYICTVQVDLPPKYDEAIKMPQLTEDVLLNIQKLRYKVQDDQVEIV